MSTGIVCGGLLALCVSCTEYTPKSRGYFRIEPPAPSYQALPVRDLPYTFRLSRWAEVELQAYSNPEASVYGSLFMLDGESASPLQFMLTDSVSHFFRGALYYDCIPNADSLAPVTRYLKQDIVELIQSFEWKK